MNANETCSRCSAVRQNSTNKLQYYMRTSQILVLNVKCCAQKFTKTPQGKTRCLEKPYLSIREIHLAKFTTVDVILLGILGPECDGSCAFQIFGTRYYKAQVDLAVR
jgi:hypothetical protein